MKNLKKKLPILIMLIAIALIATWYIYLKQSGSNQKVLYDNFRAEASNISTDILKSRIIVQGKQLEKEYDTKIGLQVSAFLAEYEKRVPNNADADLLNIQDLLFNKYGPCWGIPAGECRE